MIAFVPYRRVGMGQIDKLLKKSFRYPGVMHAVA